MLVFLLLAPLNAFAEDFSKELACLDSIQDLLDPAHNLNIPELNTRIMFYGQLAGTPSENIRGAEGEGVFRIEKDRMLYCPLRWPNKSGNFSLFNDAGLSQAVYYKKSGNLRLYSEPGGGIFAPWGLDCKPLSASERNFIHLSISRSILHKFESMSGEEIRKYEFTAACKGVPEAVANVDANRDRKAEQAYKEGRDGTQAPQ